MSSLRFAFTVDDVALHRYYNQGWHSYSSAEDLRELVDFLNGQKVPGTFFCVPFNEDIPLCDRHDYLDVIRRAQTAGHEVQLHGYRHEIFEWGIPPTSVLKVEPEARQRLRTDKAAIPQLHTYDMMLNKLRHGREIIEKVAGRAPNGFRAPCGSTCPDLYRALAKCGFEFDSSLIVNPKGWNYCVKDYPIGIMWDPLVPARPHKVAHDVTELPIMSEYTWFLTDELVNRHLLLMKEDLDHLAKIGGGLMASVCHVSPITGKNAAGLKAYEQFFRWAREKHGVEFCTMSRTIAK